jgi:hypothetical protein
MNGIDRGKYLSSILFVFAVGALLNLAFDQQIWHRVTSRNISPKEWKKAVTSGITLLSERSFAQERSNSLE